MKTVVKKVQRYADHCYATSSNPATLVFSCFSSRSIIKCSPNNYIGFCYTRDLTEIILTLEFLEFPGHRANHSGEYCLPVPVEQLNRTSFLHLGQPIPVDEKPVSEFSFVPVDLFLWGDHRDEVFVKNRNKQGLQFLQLEQNK